VPGGVHRRTINIGVEDDENVKRRCGSRERLAFAGSTLGA